MCRLLWTNNIKKKEGVVWPLTCYITYSDIHSSKKGKMAAQRAQREGRGFGWQKRKAVDKAKKFKKWKSVADTRQFSR